MPGKITKYTPVSRRKGSYRSFVKKATVKKARHISRQIANGIDNGKALTSGYAD